jgi:hypothetical protein
MEKFNCSALYTPVLFVCFYTCIARVQASLLLRAILFLAQVLFFTITYQFGLYRLIFF